MKADRIVSDGFYLPSLLEELHELTKYPKDAAATRRELEGRLRATLQTKKLWPSDKAGRCALVLWLMGQTNREAVRGVRLRHAHETVTPFGQAPKPTGMGIRAFGRPGARV
jgi:hypothetical protein